MNKFTKTMIATAVSGLIAGPASAVDFAVYQTQKAEIKATGNKCDTDKTKNLDMILAIEPGDFDDGPNTGMWFSEVFSFGAFVDGEGPLIAAKPGKDLTMDLTRDGYEGMEEALDDYVDEFCKFPAGLNFGDTMINKFYTMFSKNGKKATVKFRAEGTYYDFDADKDRSVKLNVDASLNNVD